MDLGSLIIRITHPPCFILRLKFSPAIGQGHSIGQIPQSTTRNSGAESPTAKRSQDPEVQHRGQSGGCSELASGRTIETGGG